MHDLRVTVSPKTIDVSAPEPIDDAASIVFPETVLWKRSALTEDIGVKRLVFLQYFMKNGEKRMAYCILDVGEDFPDLVDMWAILKDGCPGKLLTAILINGLGDVLCHRIDGNDEVRRYAYLPIPAGDDELGTTIIECL